MTLIQCNIKSLFFQQFWLVKCEAWLIVVCKVWNAAVNWWNEPINQNLCRRLWGSQYESSLTNPSSLFSENKVFTTRCSPLCIYVPGTFWILMNNNVTLSLNSSLVCTQYLLFPFTVKKEPNLTQPVKAESGNQAGPDDLYYVKVKSQRVIDQYLINECAAFDHHWG